MLINKSLFYDVEQHVFRLVKYFTAFYSIKGTKST